MELVRRYMLEGPVVATARRSAGLNVERILPLGRGLGPRQAVSLVGKTVWQGSTAPTFPGADTEHEQIVT